MRWWIYCFAQDGLYLLAQGRRTQIAAWRAAKKHRDEHRDTNWNYFVSSDPKLTDHDPTVRDLANDNFRYGVQPKDREGDDDCAV